MEAALAVVVGGSIGCLTRWWLGVTLNHLYPSIPPGTLLVNLVGGYLVGIAVAYFGAHLELAPEWRILAITGFLGGMTTFSAFSAEVARLIQEQRFWTAAGAISAHVGGSLALTLLGIATVALVRQSNG